MHKCIQAVFEAVSDSSSFMVAPFLQVTAACACERNWSTYDYIHNKKRNRLTADRAEKLVNVFSNLRFLKFIQRVGFEEQVWSWRPRAILRRLGMRMGDRAPCRPIT